VNVAEIFFLVEYIIIIIIIIVIFISFVYNMNNKLDIRKD